MNNCSFPFIAQRCNLSTNHFRFNRSNKIKRRRNDNNNNNNKFGLPFLLRPIWKSPLRRLFLSFIFFSVLFSINKKLFVVCSCDYIQNVLEFYIETKVIIIAKQD